VTPEERVKQWRDWAIFVFSIADGGLMTDVELQEKVCEAYDADVEAAERESDE
jgi:hypothetical protein